MKHLCRPQSRFAIYFIFSFWCLFQSAKSFWYVRFLNFWCLFNLQSRIAMYTFLSFWCFSNLQNCVAMYVFLASDVFFNLLQSSGLFTNSFFHLRFPSDVGSICKVVLLCSFSYSFWFFFVLQRHQKLRKRTQQHHFADWKKHQKRSNHTYSKTILQIEKDIRSYIRKRK